MEENEALKDLCRFLAETVTEFDRLRYEAINAEDTEYFIVMKFPVIQGTKNQIDLMNVGKQGYKKENIRKAVDLLLGR